MAHEGLLWDKNQPCRSGESGGHDGIGRSDRENREMSRGVLIDFDHTSLNRVLFTRGIRLLPILPISTAKHNAEQPCLLSVFSRRHPCLLSEMML